jgi:hypothetical protein
MPTKKADKTMLLLAISYFIGTLIIIDRLIFG